MKINDALAALLGPWASTLCLGAVLLRVSLSAALAMVIGCERSRKRHSAGLRTFILISLASTCGMLTDLFLMERWEVRLPILSAAVVISAATLSGNSILFSSKNQIKGLTTSAGLWACSIIGLAVGAGFYTLSLILFLFLLCSIALFPALEKYMKDRSNHFEMHLELKDKTNLVDFVTTIRALGIRIEDIEANPAYLHSGLSVFSVSFTVCSEELRKYKKHQDIIDALQSLPYVYHIEEI